jgi:hypothetical protein
MSCTAFVKGLLATTIVIAVLLRLFDGWIIDWHHLLVIFCISCIVLLYLSFFRIKAEREYAHLKVEDYNTVMGDPTSKLDDATKMKTLRYIQDQKTDAKLKRGWDLTLLPPDVQNDVVTFGRAWRNPLGLSKTPKSD